VFEARVINLCVHNIATDHDQEVEQIVLAALSRGTVWELVVGGSRRKRRIKSAKERESEQRRLLVAGRWMWWLPVVELVAENLMVIKVVAENLMVIKVVAENLMVIKVVAGTVERRERVNTDGKKIMGRKAGFRPTLDPIFSSSEHEISSYL
jgi:hypothetical protein